MDLNKYLTNSDNSLLYVQYFPQVENVLAAMSIISRDGCKIHNSKLTFQLFWVELYVRMFGYQWTPLHPQLVKALLTW